MNQEVIEVIEPKMKAIAVNTLNQSTSRMMTAKIATNIHKKTYSAFKKVIAQF